MATKAANASHCSEEFWIWTKGFGFQSKIKNPKSKILEWEGAASRLTPKPGDLTRVLTGLSGGERRVSMIFHYIA
jgi:hypothetical protein